MSHYNLVFKFIPMPQAMSILDAKVAVDKEWKKLETIPTWDLGKVKSRKEVILEAQSATLMDTCHLKNAELEPNLQQYKGRVVLRGDNVKDDSGAYAVFTEQGSSASQMTAAKIMDVIARLPGCDGQVDDATSAYTQVKLEDAPRLLTIHKSECPDVRTRIPRHKWPKSWANIEDPVVPLERKLYGHPLAGLLWERQFEELYWNSDRRKYRIGNVCAFIGNKVYFCQYVWMDIKMPGKKQNMAPMWKKLMKNVDLDEPTSFLDHVYLGCTQRECKPNETIVEQYAKMFESRISAGGTERLPGWEKPHAQTRKWSNFTKSQALVWMIINSSRKNPNQLENCQKFAHKLSSNACTWYELDDLTSCGQSTSLRDQSQNGLRHVTDAWQG